MTSQSFLDVCVEVLSDHHNHVVQLPTLSRIEPAPINQPKRVTTD